jgi:hypothetical protein
MIHAALIFLVSFLLKLGWDGMRDWEKLKLKGCQNIIIIYRKIKHSSEKISTPLNVSQ